MSNYDNNNKEKNGHLQDHDVALFRDFCRYVKPLKKDNRVIPASNRSTKKTIFKEKSFCKKPLQTPCRANRSSLDMFNNSDTYSIDSIQKVAADTILSYSQPHLHRNLSRKIKRGTPSIKATLDLHQYTINEALHKTTHFLQTCRKKNIRWVLIIHGKGSCSKNGIPALKSFLNQWLKTKSYVLAFHSAQSKDGGTGALYVLLKMKKGE